MENVQWAFGVRGVPDIKKHPTPSALPGRLGDMLFSFWNESLQGDPRWEILAEVSHLIHRERIDRLGSLFAIVYGASGPAVEEPRKNFVRCIKILHQLAVCITKFLYKPGVICVKIVT